MAGDNEMGDDLERAAKAFHAWVEREEGAAPWGEMCADGHTIIRQGASETLLSFLDMDETGVERISRALTRAVLAEASGSDSGDENYIEPYGPAKGKPRWVMMTPIARAVLTELRKMAGAEE